MKTSINKDVSNFETICIVLAELGDQWNPSQPLIKLPALQEKLSQLRAAAAAVDQADAQKAAAINRRQEEFRDFDKFLVRVRRMVAVEIDDARFTEELMLILRKLRRAVPEPIASSPAPSSEGDPEIPPESGNGSALPRSRSYRTFDDQLALMSDVVALLRTREDYQPNQPDLTFAALESRLAAMNSTHTAAKLAIANAASALGSRRFLLTDESTGLGKLVNLVRNHLAATAGTASNAYRQIKPLRFSRLAK